MSVTKAEMLPVVFGRCTGWLHAPKMQGRDLAVLLCPGAGQDYTNGYRPLRVLADQLAEAGFAVLRFDYPGTGDAAEPEDADLWRAWQASVRLAADWLQQASGARRLVLAGLRIGAALAALEASQRDDVAALLLFEPILQLRSFVLQAAAESRFRKSAPGQIAPDADGLELGELKFSASDVQEMRQTDLGRLSLPGAPLVMIFSRKPAERLAERLTLWQAQGVRLRHAPFEDLAALLRPNQHSGEPEIDGRELLSWLDEIPHESAGALAAAPGQLHADDWDERVIRFGGGRMAGVLCQPSGGSVLTLLIGNSGGNPRHGFARFSVALARRLAAAGIASFRFDFAGLGDSQHLEAGIDTQSDVFLQDRTADFSQALDALEALGHRRFAVHGLCSGAYHAVQAAYRDSRIGMLAVINLPWFTLRRETPGPDSTVSRMMAAFRSRQMPGLFMFSNGDAGLTQFERHFGPGGGALGEFPGMRLCISELFDHELTERHMQEAAILGIEAFLQDHEPAPEAALAASSLPD